MPRIGTEDRLSLQLGSRSNLSKILPWSPSQVKHPIAPRAVALWVLRTLLGVIHTWSDKKGLYLVVACWGGFEDRGAGILASSERSSNISSDTEWFTSFLMSSSNQIISYVGLLYCTFFGTERQVWLGILKAKSKFNTTATVGLAPNVVTVLYFHIRFSLACWNSHWKSEIARFSELCGWGAML